jgi:hypothetical protein
VILSHIRSKEINDGVLFYKVCFEFRPTLSMTPYQISLTPSSEGDNRKSNHDVYNMQYIRLYRTIILPVVLFGCQTWLLKLRDESGLRVFENRVLRRIFGPKRDVVTGE